MPREPIPTWYYALVVVRKENKFLLVQESGGEWYFPAGRVETGEQLTIAACRETLEEAGIHEELDGILKIQHTPMESRARLRIFFTARPKDDTPPKKQADKESLQAEWFTLDEIKSLPLRASEVWPVYKYVSDGGATYSLDLLSFEGASWL